MNVKTELERNGMMRKNKKGKQTDKMVLSECKEF